jgi:hypothetical protein
MCGRGPPIKASRMESFCGTSSCPCRFEPWQMTSPKLQSLNSGSPYRTQVCDPPAVSMPALQTKSLSVLKSGLFTSIMLG